jgi:flagellum-specific ATP synthase
MRKSVVVVSTSEQPALMKLRAAFTATAIAEYFRTAAATSSSSWTR